jgi:protein SCO1/2
MRKAIPALVILSAGLGAAVGLPAFVPAEGASMRAHMADQGSDQAARDEDAVRRTDANYVIPNVTLVRHDGESVKFPAELDDGRPVVLNFIYTSCTTICPLSSQVFEQFQDALGKHHAPIHLVSISIDPEQDTPARLRAYAAQFHAKRGWDYYSGPLAAIVAVQTAFNAYRGDKMQHSPLTLMRQGPGKPWVRLDGFARADDLMSERKAWESPPAALVAR